jgi:hypothetical protein
MSWQIRVREASLAGGIALSLAAQVTGVMAFSTDPVAPPSQTTTNTAPMSPFGQPLALPGQSPKVDLNDPLSQAGKSKGMELTIPGIGSVGTLPKLDFGLELLYGSKGGPEALQLDQHGQESDVGIKGTFTHKF